jgi:hypothetical protein
MLTSKSVTGILHLCNQTLIELYSKRNATVETATFGSEFTAARLAADQIIYLRMASQNLGVPVNEKCFLCLEVISQLLKTVQYHILQ